MSDPFTSDISARLGERSGDPSWLRDERASAFLRFSGLPWPDVTSEAWRPTDLRALDLDGLDLAPAPLPPVASLDGVPAEVLIALGDVGERDGLSIAIDGTTVHTSIAPDLVARGVIFTSLSEAARAHEDLVRAWVGRGGVSEHEEKIAMMNAAFRGDGVFVYVPPGVEVRAPLQAFHWMSRAGIGVFPRLVLVADEGSSVTFVDHYASPVLGGTSLSAARVEIYANPASTVSYLAVQDWAQTVWHFNVQRARVDRDATVRSLAVALGARASRSLVECMLDGSGAHSELLGVYFGDHDQHIDNRSLQDHIAPNTTSDLYYKGALKGSARAVYAGLVRINKGAQKSDAKQANRNLLLSEGASADPKPFLEIEANDVHCSHAVSVGRPDEEALFYLQSRGLSAADAERLLVKGFFQEILDRVQVPDFRIALERAVEEELALEDER